MRKQPEVLRVAHRCLAALEDPFVRLNNRLRTAYVTWLVAMLIWLLYCCMPHGVLPWLASAPERKFSPFEKRLQWHVLCCLAAMLLTNLGSAALMLLLISHGDHERAPRVQREQHRPDPRCETRTLRAARRRAARTHAPAAGGQ